METPSCPGCQQRDAHLAVLQAQVTTLEAKVRELEARLKQNASNSSLPPSANPPQAPKPVVKKPTGRKPGAQPGHPPHRRRRLPPERLQRVVPFLPKTCAHCQTPLPAPAGPDDPEPTWHQVADLPPVTAHVIEYQGHGRRCPHCGELTWATIPEALRARTMGPRRAAVMALLSGAHFLSRRGIETLVETVCAVPVALGTVMHLEQEMRQARQPAYTEAVQAV